MNSRLPPQRHARALTDGFRCSSTFLAVAMVGAVGSMLKMTIPQREPCHVPSLARARCRCLRTRAMAHHVVARSCNQNFQLNFHRGGCVGSLSERHSGSTEAAARACREFEAVVNPKLIPVSRQLRRWLCDWLRWSLLRSSEQLRSGLELSGEAFSSSSALVASGGLLSIVGAAFSVALPAATRAAPSAVPWYSSRNTV